MAELFSYKFVVSDTANKARKVRSLRRISGMSEFESEVKKAEKELEQSLAPIGEELETQRDEYLGDIKMQAQEYGQRLQDAAARARDYASDRFAQAGDKFKDLQNKDPKELVEEAKQYAREKPGHAILISAAVGLVLGLLLKGRR